MYFQSFSDYCFLGAVNLSNVLLFQIRSDLQSGSNVVYSLEGVGATQYPFNVFVVDPVTGNVRVTKILDREEIDTYNVSYSTTQKKMRHNDFQIILNLYLIEITA